MESISGHSGHSRDQVVAVASQDGVHHVRRSDGSAPRVVGWLSLGGVSLIAGIAYPHLYAAARGADSPFLANLDAIVMTATVPVFLLAWIEDLLPWAFPSAFPHLPRREAPGPTMLYRLYAADGALLYIGVSRVMERRMRQHSQTKEWWPDVAATEAKAYRTRTAAARAEHVAIMSENPRYNVARLSLEGHLRTAGAQ